VLVDEDLEEVLNSNDLIFAEIEVLVLSTLEFITVCLVIHEGLDDAERDVHDILLLEGPLIILVSALDVAVRGEVLGGFTLLLFTLLE
jgi:hypothetical protein